MSATARNKSQMWTSQVRETLQPLRSGLHVRSVSCAFGHDAFLSPGVRICIGCQVAGPSEPLNMSKVLVVGVAVIHPVRGRGVVTAVNHQSERHKPYWISFENGEVHNYNESSAQKLRIASTAAAAERYVPGACDPSLRTSASLARSSLSRISGAYAPRCDHNGLSPSQGAIVGPHSVQSIRGCVGAPYGQWKGSQCHRQSTPIRFATDSSGTECG